MLWFKLSIRELKWPKGLGNVTCGGLAFSGAIAELGWLWLQRVSQEEDLMDFPSALFLAATPGGFVCPCFLLGVLDAPLVDGGTGYGLTGRIGCSFGVVQDNAQVAFDVGSYLAHTYVYGMKQSSGHRSQGPRLGLALTKTGPSQHLAIVLFFFWSCI